MWYIETNRSGETVRRTGMIGLFLGVMLSSAGMAGRAEVVDAVAGGLTFTLAEAAGMTTVVLIDTAGGYRRGGLQERSEPVDGTLLVQLQRLERFLETGKSGRP